MTEIIPSINAQAFPEVQGRIKKVESHVRWCHIDITDGIFSKHLTWNNPADLRGLKTSLNIEVHLMIESPEQVIDQWLVFPVKRVIVHLEAMENPEVIIKKCRDKGIEVGFAIKPETNWEGLEPWFGRVDIVQVLCVHPGPSGQDANWPTMLEKIDHIHAACPQCIIEADGGINQESIKKVSASGATLLVSGSFIFDASNIKLAIAQLKNEI